MAVNRHRKNFFLVALVLSGLGLAGPGMATSTGKPAYPEIEYAAPDQSVWTTRTNAQGEPDNPLQKLAEALFSRAGIPWHGKTYPASRLFRYLQNGTAQFSILVKAPALQECCLFSRKPIAVAEIRAYRRVSSPPVRSVEGLAGKQVITIRGYSYGGIINFISDPANRISNNVTDSHASAFRMLDNGRADYVIDYAGPAAEVLTAERIDGMVHDLLSRQDVYLVLSKSYPDAPEVMQRLEAIAETLDVDGMLAPVSGQERKAPLTKPRSSR